MFYDVQSVCLNVFVVRKALRKALCKSFGGVRRSGINMYGCCAKPAQSLRKPMQNETALGASWRTMVGPNVVCAKLCTKRWAHLCAKRCAKLWRA